MSYLDAGKVIPVQRFGSVAQVFGFLPVLANVHLFQLLLQVHVALQAVGVDGGQGGPGHGQIRSSLLNWLEHKFQIVLWLMARLLSNLNCDSRFRNNRLIRSGWLLVSASELPRQSKLEGRGEIELFTILALQVITHLKK